MAGKREKGKRQAERRFLFVQSFSKLIWFRSVFSLPIPIPYYVRLSILKETDLSISLLLSLSLSAAVSVS
jgi:hypothetical protein